MTKILDQGYVTFIESWGSDKRIVESARMSTAKGFLGWGEWKCQRCAGTDTIGPNNYATDEKCPHCSQGTMVFTAGDEKLLKFLWDKKHGTPFEMAGLTIEVKAPLVVFREWHRHRVPFGYNEMSARYVALPDENYHPTVERLIEGNTKGLATTNRQAQGNGAVLTLEAALSWLIELDDVYQHAQKVYEHGIELGVPKELARLPVPVARYSVMRATGNLRGWLGFMALRCAPDAQWEIRQFANEVAALVKEHFPRVYDVSCASLGLTL